MSTEVGSLHLKAEVESSQFDQSVDGMARRLRGLGKDLDSTSAMLRKVSSSSNNFDAGTKSLQTMSARLDKVRESLNRVPAGSRKFTTLAKEVRRLEGELRDVQRAADGISGRDIFDAFTASAPLIAVGALHKKMLSLADEANRAEIRFTTLLGSAEEAQKVLREIDNTSGGKSSFGRDEIRNATFSLISMGIAAEDVQEDLAMLRDIAVNTPRSLEELATMYGKMNSQGIVQAEELNQILEAGIPILDKLAERMGVNASEVKKMGSEGKIAFEDLRAALASYNEEVTKGSDANLAKSASEQAEDILQNLEIIAETVGKDLLTAFEPLLAMLAESTSYLAQMVQEMGPMGRAFATGAVLAGSLYAVMLSMKGVMPLINAQIAQLPGNMQKSVHGAMRALGPLMNLAGGILITVTVVISYIKANTSSASASLTDNIEETFQKDAEALKQYQKEFEEAAEGFPKALDRANELTSQGIYDQDPVADFLTERKQRLIALTNQMRELGKITDEQYREVISDIITGFDDADDMLTDTTEAFKGAATNMRNAVKTAIDLKPEVGPIVSNSGNNQDSKPTLNIPVFFSNLEEERRRIQEAQEEIGAGTFDIPLSIEHQDAFTSEQMETLDQLRKDGKIEYEMRPILSDTGERTFQTEIQIKDTADSETLKAIEKMSQETTVLGIDVDLEGAGNLGKNIENLGKEIGDEIGSALQDVGNIIQANITSPEGVANIARGLKGLTASVGGQMQEMYQAQAQLAQADAQNKTQWLQWFTQGYIAEIDKQLEADLEKYDRELDLLKDQKEALLDAEREYQESLQEIKDEYAARRKEELYAEMQAEFDRMEEEQEEEIEKLEAQNLKKHEIESQKADLDADLEEQKKQLKKQYDERLKQDIAANDQKLLDDQKKRDEERKKNEEALAAQIEALEKKKADAQEDAERRKQEAQKQSAIIEWMTGRSAFQANKVAQTASIQMQVAQALLSAVTGVAMSFGQGGLFGLAAGLTASTLVTGMALSAAGSSLQAINAAQYPPPPVFAKGGISGLDGRPGIVSEYGQPEMVIPFDNPGGDFRSLQGEVAKELLRGAGGSNGSMTVHYTQQNTFAARDDADYILEVVNRGFFDTVRSAEGGLLS